MLCCEKKKCIHRFPQPVFKNCSLTGHGGNSPLILGAGAEVETGRCLLEVSLIYRSSSRTRTTPRNPISKRGREIEKKRGGKVEKGEER